MQSIPSPSLLDGIRHRKRGEQSLGVRMLRGTEHFGSGTFFHQLALIEHCDTIGEQIDEFGIGQLVARYFQAKYLDRKSVV